MYHKLVIVTNYVDEMVLECPQSLHVPDAKFVPIEKLAAGSP